MGNMEAHHLVNTTCRGRMMGRLLSSRPPTSRSGSGWQGVFVICLPVAASSATSGSLKQPHEKQDRWYVAGAQQFGFDFVLDLTTNLKPHDASWVTHPHFQ